MSNSLQFKKSINKKKMLLKEFRGRGLGKLLMNSLLNHKKLKHLRSFRLGTEDAHGLYAQLGFTPLRKLLNMMERISG